MFLTPTLILGILLADLASLPNWLLILVCALVSIVLFRFQNKGKQLFLPSVLILLFALGILLMNHTRSDFNTLISGDTARMGLVTETETTKDAWKKVLITIENEKRGEKWQSTQEKVVLYSRDQLKRGDVILFHSELERIENSGNPGEFDAKSYWKGKNIASIGFLGKDQYVLLDYQPPSTVSLFFENLRNHLSSALSKFLPEREASIAKALLLGDKSTLSTETRQSFSSAGAMHVLAISGLHVGIIMYLLFFILKRFSRFISRRMAVVLSLIFIWVFVGVTGASPSVVRAALMFSVLLIGQESGRIGSNLNTLSFSAFLLLLFDPLLIFDIGFQLSYCAMLGIFLYLDRITLLLKFKNKLFRTAWEGTALGIAAQVFTIPLMLYYFHQFPNYFWLTNLGVMLVAGVTLGLGLLFFALKFVPFVNSFLAASLTWTLFSLAQFVTWIESLPASVAKGFSPGVPEMILFYLCVFLLAWKFNKRVIKVGVLSVLVLIIVGWQWDRGERTVQEELVVFNSNQPVLALKRGNMIYGMYLHGNKEKAFRYLETYEKVQPGKLELIELKEGVTNFEGDDGVRVEMEDLSLKVHVGDETWALRMSYAPVLEEGCKVIDMPYMEKFDGHYNLKDGALRIPLKQSD